MQPELIGYADRFSVIAGQPIRFMVSTDADAYDVAFVRLIHADTNPNGPGLKTEVMDSPPHHRCPGRKQIAQPGSYIVVENTGTLADLTSFTIQAWIYPTLMGRLQGIMSQGNSFCLYVNECGCLVLRIGGVDLISISTPLYTHQWYFVVAVYDTDQRQARLYQRPLLKWPHPDSVPVYLEAPTTAAPATDNAPLLIAALSPSQGSFNGKIDHPRLFSRALSSNEIEALMRGAVPSTGLAADWDFSADIGSTCITDHGPCGLHGRTVNAPMRAVTGHNWTGQEVDFKRAPAEYSAIHFHEDDLDDARWEVDFELAVPDNWHSGVYAARLTAGNQVDYIPFFVRPRAGVPGAKAAFLVPTMTYLAYANYRAKDRSRDENGQLREPLTQPLEDYIAEHPELGMSLYDLHTDGSGCCYSSRLRPIHNMRPQYRWPLVGGPRHFSADLYLVDWLEVKGFAYDVFTDEDLQFEGMELLQSYKVILTGTHPEYWTTPMLDALEQYLATGGRLMYLGGNGFYWITSVDPEHPYMIEVRRSIAGTRAWESAPGECYHSTTGEYGGLWRYRGRAPNCIAGIGFTAQGWDGRAPGYTRQPDSFNPRVDFIFEGIGNDEVIGDFGLVLGGAAGDELDRADTRLGTPPHALVLASSSGYAKTVMPVVEDFNSVTVPLISGENWKVRADIVYFETPNDGAVFSTGSITWCASLSHNQYQNNVSRVTENVLRRFLA
jgi:N,N-dimethylformamidase